MDMKKAALNLVDYIFEHEYNDFKEHLKIGDDPEHHIYYSALYYWYNGNEKRIIDHIKEEFDYEY